MAVFCSELPKEPHHTVDLETQSVGSDTLWNARNVRRGGDREPQFRTRQAFPSLSMGQGANAAYSTHDLPHTTLSPWGLER